MNLQELWNEYAKGLDKSADALTDLEKRQAFLDAVLEGKRIDPFATIAEAIAAEREVYAKIAEKWAAHYKAQSEDPENATMNKLLEAKFLALTHYAAVIRARGEKK